MPSMSSAFAARVNNRLARHFCAVPYRLPANNPMVSFTSDDIPQSAASAGAQMLEEYGGRGTFYISGGLVGQWSGALGRHQHRRHFGVASQRPRDRLPY